jgi:hypothetical protein
MENLGKAFTLPFHQKEWGMKIFLGSLFLLLSIIGLGIPVVCGYMVRVCQRVMKDEEEKLPEWSDVGVLFVTGVKYVVVLLLYQIPILLLMIPLFSLAAVGAMIDLSGSAAVLLTLYVAGLILLTVPYTILFVLLLPVITYRFALRERLVDGLDVSSVFKDFLRQWPTATMFAIVAVIVKTLAGLGILLFIIGILPTLFYSLLVFAALSGFLYRGLPGEAAA